MTISFSKQHAGAIAVTVILFSVILILFFNKSEVTTSINESAIVEETRQPVENYQEEVGRLMALWETEFASAPNSDEKISSIDSFQRSLQVLIIHAEDKDYHLNLVLNLSKLKQAIKNNDSKLEETLLNQLSKE